MTKQQPIFIGIAGGSASGKTTLAHAIQDLAQPSEVGIIYLDYYYRTQDHLKPEQREKTNYDHPDSQELDLLAQQLGLLKAGESVDLPVYDFTIHNRAKSTKKFETHPIIIVEGIFALQNEDLRAYYSDTIFMDAPDDLRLKRRSERDIRERGRTKQSVVEQWNETVQPMYLEYCKPSQKFARLIISPESDLAEIASELLKHYRSMVSAAKK